MQDDAAEGSAAEESPAVLILATDGLWEFISDQARDSSAEKRPDMVADAVRLTGSTGCCCPSRCSCPCLLHGGTCACRVACGFPDLKQHANNEREAQRLLCCFSRFAGRERVLLSRRTRRQSAHQSPADVRSHRLQSSKMCPFPAVGFHVEGERKQSSPQTKNIPRATPSEMSA